MQHQSNDHRSKTNHSMTSLKSIQLPTTHAPAPKPNSTPHRFGRFAVLVAMRDSRRRRHRHRPLFNFSCMQSATVARKKRKKIAPQKSEHQLLKIKPAVER